MTKQEISSGIIIYRKTTEGPKFLLLYHGGHYWNFAKGKVEKEEGSYEAAIREVREETGLGRADLKLDSRFRVHDQYVFPQKKEKTFKIVVYFLAETKNPIIKISKEHQGYGWFLYKDAVRMLLYQNLKNNLRRAYEIIRGKSLPSREKNTKRQSRDL